MEKFEVTYKKYSRHCNLTLSTTFTVNCVQKNINITNWVINQEMLKDFE